MVTLENHIGKISVTDGYLCDLVRHTVCECFGVADVCNIGVFRSAVSAITKGRFFNRRGVAVKTSPDGQLAIDIHIKVSYGTNIAAASESITHKVSYAVEEAIGIKVSRINVYVDDMKY